jgi:hypothetical protein
MASRFTVYALLVLKIDHTAKPRINGLSEIA